jgi:hypothetical protein
LQKRQPDLKEEQKLLTALLETNLAAWNTLQSDKETVVTAVKQTLKEIQEAMNKKGEELLQTIESDTQRRTAFLLTQKTPLETALWQNNRKEQRVMDQLLSSPPELFPLYYKEWNGLQNRPLIGGLSHSMSRLSIEMNSGVDVLRNIASLGRIETFSPPLSSSNPLLEAITKDGYYEAYDAPEQKWEGCRVVDLKSSPSGQTCFITFTGYARYYDRWVERALLRPLGTTFTSDEVAHVLNHRTKKGTGKSP